MSQAPRIAPHSLLVLLPALVACGETNPGPAPSPPQEAPVAFSRCDLYSEGGGPAAECATLDLPLRREEPEGRTLRFFVKRYRPPGGTGKKQLWLLQGGPGGAGDAFDHLVEALGPLAPDIDYYLPDHRGTGRSTRLSCPRQEAEESLGGVFIAATEWAACRRAVTDEWGDDLAAFTTTAAAGDLGLAIARLRAPGQEVFVYGASYGTLWAQRYLQLFPEQATGVILDSVVPPGASLTDQDAVMNAVGREVAARCDDDPACAANFGPDAWARADALYARLDAGHCPVTGEYGPARLVLRRTFGQMMMNFALRPYVWFALRRAERCSAEDVTALRHWLDSFYSPDLPVPIFYRYFSFILSYHIVLSEIWDPDVTAADLKAIRDGALISRDVTEGLALNMKAWPRYPRDGYNGKTADTAVPMLIMNGTLDPATPIEQARPLRGRYSRPHQTFVEVPDGTHGLVGNSPTPDGPSCGTRLMLSFLRDPRGEVDTSCLGALTRLHFAGDPNVTTRVFGGGSAWGE